MATETQLTFLSNAKNYTKHLEDLNKSKAVAVIAPLDAPDLSIPSIRFKNCYEGLVGALNYFNPVSIPEAKISSKAIIGDGCSIDTTAIVEPGAVICNGACVGKKAWIKSGAVISDNAKVGDNCIIYPNVSILDNCIVGNDCIIHSGTVVGSDGFGFTKINNVQIKVPQIGNVVIENSVEIGANVTIDRATMGSTLIGEGTKIDNLVHIAHNVQIGKNCTIVAQVGISGTTILEDNVTLAGQCGTVGHVTVGKNTIVAARGVVTNDVAPNSFVSGFPIKSHSEERRIMAATRKLPDILKRIRAIEKELSNKK